MTVWAVFLVNPDMNHNSWGVRIIDATNKVLPRASEAWKSRNEWIGDVEGDCTTIVEHFLDFHRTGFHQGGCHYDEKCRGNHYIEFFGVKPTVEMGLDLLDYISEFVNNKEGLCRS